MEKYYIVWNDENKGEGVIFDNFNDAYQTSTGEFQQMASTIGTEFFEAYEDNAPLPIQPVTIKELASAYDQMTDAGVVDHD